MQRNIELKNGWLHLPIGRDVPRHYVKFEADGEQIAELYLGLVSGEPDFWCGMELEKYIGKTITLTIADDAPNGLIDGIVEGGAMTAQNPLYADLYKEPLRPQYHFSSRRGWLNDPNGLVFDGENYHLYYQHNPYGIKHGGVNMHWGHAVSPDGVHWTEHSDGIRPWVCKCHIASGSCIVDYDGVAGYGKGVIIAAFTHLGSRDFHKTPDEEYPSEGQFLAYSTNGGDSFTLFPECPVIPTEDGKSWRDPRIFADPKGGFGIAVYETNEQGNCVSFYHSDDLHHWERTAQAGNLYECPDLFRLTPVNGGEPKWVLYGADSMYRIGNFDNGVFTQESEGFPLDFGTCTYAGQTWTGRDDTDGRMHISWLRSGDNAWSDPMVYPDMPFSQQMTVPCLLKLVRTEDGYRVTRTPIPALDSLHDGEAEPQKIAACKAAELDLLPQGDLRLTIDSENPISVRVGEFGFDYDPKTGHLVLDGGHRTYTLLKGGALSLRVLSDTMSCEIFLQDEISYSLETTERTMKITGEGEFSAEGERYAMRSIWN